MCGSELHGYGLPSVAEPCLLASWSILRRKALEHASQCVHCGSLGERPHMGANPDRCDRQAKSDKKATRASLSDGPLDDPIRQSPGLDPRTAAGRARRSPKLDSVRNAPAPIWAGLGVFRATGTPNQGISAPAEWLPERSDGRARHRIVRGGFVESTPWRFCF